MNIDKAVEVVPLNRPQSTGAVTVYRAVCGPLSSETMTFNDATAVAEELREHLRKVIT